MVGKFSVPEQSVSLDAYEALRRTKASAETPEPTSSARLATKVSGTTSGGPPVAASAVAVGLALAVGLAVAVAVGLAVALAVGLAVAPKKLAPKKSCSSALGTSPWLGPWPCRRPSRWPPQPPDLVGVVHVRWCFLLRLTFLGDAFPKP